MGYQHPHTSKNLTVPEENRLRELLNYIKMTKDNEKSNKWVAEAVAWVDNLVWRRMEHNPTIGMFDAPVDETTKEELLDKILGK